MKEGRKLFHYKLNFDSRYYEKLTGEDCDKDKSGLFTSTFIEDLGDKFHENEAGDLFERYCYSPEFERHDPDLIKVVEELGKEASAFVSNLKIVEIPKEIEYQIEEYDGNEWIAEKHRTWS